MKKIRIWIFLVVLMMSMAAVSMAAGKTFTSVDSYQTAKPLASLPKTYEATVLIPTSWKTDRAGVILGNYFGAGACFSFEIFTNGNPRLYTMDNNLAQGQCIFDKVNVATGKKVHIAIVVEGSSASCYIDGVIKQTVTNHSLAQNVSMSNNSVLGGDLRERNSLYFKGEIYDVALYSDVRTAAEILGDYHGTATDKSGLMASYDTTIDAPTFPDRSGNGYVIETKGKSFASYPYYQSGKTLASLPGTYEAWIRLSPSLVGGRCGVIYGNYGGSSECMNFEVVTGGNPRLYITDNSNVVYDYVFRSVNVCQGTWVHLAIVKDTNAVSCYINGELKETTAVAGTPKNITLTAPPMLGGDLRPDNTQYFKGEIYTAAFFDDARSAQEVAADYQGTGNAEGIMASYTPAYVGEVGSIEDESGNAMHLVRIEDGIWIPVESFVTDYAFSIAVVGDTQNMARYYQDRMTAIYDYIKDSAYSKNIRFVCGLGDITDLDSTAEWALARAVIDKLDGVVPYSLCRGNHDSVAKFNTYVPYDRYREQGVVGYNGSLLNSYQTFTVGNLKYLVMTLDFGAKDDVLAWANQVVSDHPDHNVIVTTHAYLFRDGTTLDAGDVVPPTIYDGANNNGDHMWNEFIKNHENIVLVLSGHDPCDDVVVAQDKGVHGNVITQMLVDPQSTDITNEGLTGLVCMLYFSEDGKTVDVEYYSTVRKALFKKSNQFRMTINAIASEPALEDAKIHVENFSFDVTLDGNNNEGVVYAALYDEENRLVAVHNYPAAPKVNVSFTGKKPGAYVKVMWWNGGVTPVCLSTIPIS